MSISYYLLLSTSSDIKTVLDQAVRSLVTPENIATAQAGYWVGDTYISFLATSGLDLSVSESESVNELKTVKSTGVHVSCKIMMGMRRDEPYEPQFDDMLTVVFDVAAAFDCDALLCFNYDAVLLMRKDGIWVLSSSTDYWDDTYKNTIRARGIEFIERRFDATDKLFRGV